jgi:uncharacterized coiled-coil DUF342 family protein
MNDINNQTLQEIVDFINLTPFQTDINLFERLNSDELLNIYMNSLIYLGAANGYEDFELNEEEESLFATVVRENRCLKIIKITALINHLFQRFGHIPNFSPVYIFSPSVSITQSTLMKLLDTKKKIEEYKEQYKLISKDYNYTIKSHQDLDKLVKDSQDKKNILIKTLDEGNKLSNELKNNIEKYAKQIDELNPLINNNKENLVKLNEEINKKNNQSEQLSKKIEENSSILEKLKERVVPNPENINQFIKENKLKLDNYSVQQNNLQKDLDILYKNNEICLKINEKLANLKSKVEEYHDYDVKNKLLYEKKAQFQNDITQLEKELNECKEKYNKNVEILKNTENMLKNHQKEFNNLKSKLSLQIKENEKIKNDLKEILDHINNQILQYKAEIDKINVEKNELKDIRDEYAQVLGSKFQDIIKKQNLYYQMLDKSLELYENYNILDKKEEQK